MGAVMAAATHSSFKAVSKDWWVQGDGIYLYMGPENAGTREQGEVEGGMGDC